jgi:hypothetical protein
LVARALVVETVPVVEPVDPVHHPNRGRPGKGADRQVEGNVALLRPTQAPGIAAARLPARERHLEPTRTGPDRARWPCSEPDLPEGLALRC